MINKYNTNKLNLSKPLCIRAANCLNVNLETLFESLWNFTRNALYPLAEAMETRSTLWVLTFDLAEDAHITDVQLITVLLAQMWLMDPILIS